MVTDAARPGQGALGQDALGHGALAAEIATLIGERGLGGDDIDMRERLAALRRDRSPRARDARHMAERWAEIAQAPIGTSSHPGRASARPSASLGGVGEHGDPRRASATTPPPSPPPL